MGLLDKIDLSKSNLPLEGNKTERDKWLKKILKKKEDLVSDQLERKAIYKVRKDFYSGNQGSYTTVVGKVAKEKKGHANAVYNYAGKTVKKISYSLANNPPKITTPGRKVSLEMAQIERIRAQAVESFEADVLARNMFWKGPYRAAVFNQVGMGDAALKLYPMQDGDGDWDIKIGCQKKMENLLVGWSDSYGNYDFVVAVDEVSIQFVEEQYGITIPMSLVTDKNEEATNAADSGHESGYEWGSHKGGARPLSPSGQNKTPTITQIEYDDQNIYALVIGGTMVQFQVKDGIEYPKGQMWLLIPNLPSFDSPWSSSDIDDLIDPQVEFNEAANEERDYIRVGSAQKFVAYNMEDFDPESVKTGSGVVIFIDSPDGSARFEPLKTNVNVFPSQTFLQRTRDVIYDMGVPKVTFGAGGADSGRSKAIDYQSMIDLTIYKRDCWELVFAKLSERLQKLGYFYFKSDFFEDPDSDQFIVRYPDFDWTDILPVTQADKVVNVLNKVMMGLPFRLAFQELGYKDVESVLMEMREEMTDEDLMIYRSKMWQVSGGLVNAQARAQQQIASMEQGPPATAQTPGAPATNAAGPTLVPEQNEGGGSQPMAQKGGTTSFSTPSGFINRTRQNLTAAGR